MDHQGKVIEFNPAAQRIFGYSHEQAIGRPLAELIIPLRLREDHRRGLTHYLATGAGPVLNLGWNCRRFAPTAPSSPSS